MKNVGTVTKQKGNKFQLSKKEWDEAITICDSLPENIKFSPARVSCGMIFIRSF